MVATSVPLQPREEPTDDGCIGWQELFERERMLLGDRVDEVEARATEAKHHLANIRRHLHGGHIDAPTPKAFVADQLRREVGAGPARCARHRLEQLDDTLGGRARLFDERGARRGNARFPTYLQ